MQAPAEANFKGSGHGNLGEKVLAQQKLWDIAVQVRLKWIQKSFLGLKNFSRQTGLPSWWLR